MFKNINLETELRKNREQISEEVSESILNDAFSRLYDDYCQERRIQESIQEGVTEQKGFGWGELDADRIYTIDQIRKTAIQHRLRFLDSKQFKDDIPYDAIFEIKRLEKVLGVELNNFKIMAPGERFVLEDCDKDPLLFLELSNNYYYLIHKWGNDLAWYRRWATMPLQSFTSLGLSIAGVSLLLALLIPTDIVGTANGHEVFARLAFFFWCLVCITSVVTYIGFAFFKNVSANQWNSPFFKQEF